MTTQNYQNTEYQKLEKKTEILNTEQIFLYFPISGTVPTINYKLII